MAYPDSPAELYELRRFAVAALCLQLGLEIDDYITYAEVARETSTEDAQEADFEYVYGANLAHALALARQAIAREAIARQAVGRIVLVTYSLPSAHHTESGDVFFSVLPLPHTLDVTKMEARACAAEGIRVDTMLILRPVSDAAATPEPTPASDPDPDPDPSAPRRIGMRFVEATITSDKDLIDFFQDLAATTGGSMVSVRPDDDVPSAITQLFSGTSS